MKDNLIKPAKHSIIYDDLYLYACLAKYPITKGHTIVVWKKIVKDLNLLNKKEYDYLMDKVDEVNHVHWHLVPRYNKKGFDVFAHTQKKNSDFSLVNKIQKKLILKI
jgi:diadenosine tetraphosphate (Ap4A) HIT family hydrolase